MVSIARSKLPLIVIVGPTASGKTALAIQIAKQLDGEIICADSRTVYRDMDIGTAKPTAEEQAGVPHWGLDLVGPEYRYTAAEFKTYATTTIAHIRARDKVPIMVGGTGLYVDSVLFDYDFPAPPSLEQRQMFEMMSLEELTLYCRDNNVELPEDDKNTRRILRAMYAEGVAGKRSMQPIGDSIVVGIATSKHTLDERIAIRTEQMFTDGVVEEARRLGKKYGWEAEAMTSNVYRSILPFLQGVHTIEDVKVDFMTRDRQLAKRQMTWFRRNQWIAWGTREDIERYVIKCTRL